MASLAVLRYLRSSSVTNLLKYSNIGLSASSRTFCTTFKLYQERRYTEKHEWVTVDGDISTIGITDHAQQALGDVVYVQLPDVDTEFQQMDECGAVESVKAASELYSPVSGVVTEKNTAVEDTPSLLNSSCYDKGWLFKLRLTKPKEWDGLLTEDGYQKLIKELE